MSEIVICPECGGDGKETCHNPDHGFFDALIFHDVGRLGCPGCLSYEDHKTGSGANCDLCDGIGKVKRDIADLYNE